MRNDETLWSRTVAQVPNCARALTNLGAMRGRQGKLQEAHALLSRALSIRPGYCKTIVNLAKVLVKRAGPGEAQRGIALLREATCIPRVQQLLALAFSYSDLKRWDEAAAAFREVLSLQPESPKGNLGLARVLRRLARPGAEAHLRAALRTRPSYGPALYDLGEMLAQRCQVQEARALLERLQRGEKHGSTQAAAVEALLADMARRCK